MTTGFKYVSLANEPISRVARRLVQFAIDATRFNEDYSGGDGENAKASLPAELCSRNVAMSRTSREGKTDRHFHFLLEKIT